MEVRKGNTVSWCSVLAAVFRWGICPSDSYSSCSPCSSFKFPSWLALEASELEMPAARIPLLKYTELADQESAPRGGTSAAGMATGVR